MAAGNIPSAMFTDQKLRCQAEKISKGAWMDLYVDLYCQCFGEEKSEEEILDDAENRLRILKANGIR